MTSNTRPDERILGNLGSAGGKGIVRIEVHFDTGVDDVWSALTDPSRLARWYGEVAGDLRPGGEYRAHLLASGWEGTGRVEACDPSRRLLVRIKDADEPEEQDIEVTLTADGDQTILVWEERGMSGLQEYYKGHAEDRFVVIGLFETVTGAASANALLTRETTPLEPGVVDHKLYVRGIGTVVEQTVKGGDERNELVSVTRSR